MKRILLLFSIFILFQIQFLYANKTLAVKSILKSKKNYYPLLNKQLVLSQLKKKMRKLFPELYSLTKTIEKTKKYKQEFKKIIKILTDERSPTPEDEQKVITDQIKLLIKHFDINNNKFQPIIKFIDKIKNIENKKKFQKIPDLLKKIYPLNLNMPIPQPKIKTTAQLEHSTHTIINNEKLDFAEYFRSKKSLFHTTKRWNYKKHTDIKTNETFIAKHTDSNNKGVYLYTHGEKTGIGDLHGSYDNLIELLEKNRFLERISAGEDVNLIFLGDYVDRRNESVEILVSILTLKEQYPNNVFLLRGNHETRPMTETYGLKKELTEWCNDEEANEILDAANELFDEFPLFLVTNDGELFMHGAPPVDIKTGELILDLTKFLEGNILEWYSYAWQLLWNDPNKIIVKTIKSRNRGYFLPKQLLENFMDKMELTLIIRSHEYKKNILHAPFSDRIITIFSTGGPYSYYKNFVEEPYYAIIKNGALKLVPIRKEMNIYLRLFTKKPKLLVWKNGEYWELDKIVSKIENFLETNYSETTANILSLTANIEKTPKQIKSLKNFIPEEKYQNKCQPLESKLKQNRNTLYFLIIEKQLYTYKLEKFKTKLTKEIHPIISLKDNYIYVSKPLIQNLAFLHNNTEPMESKPYPATLFLQFLMEKIVYHDNNPEEPPDIKKTINSEIYALNQSSQERIIVLWGVQKYLLDYYENLLENMKDDATKNMLKKIIKHEDYNLQLYEKIFEHMQKQEIYELDLDSDIIDWNNVEQREPENIKELVAMCKTMQDEA